MTIASTLRRLTSGRVVPLDELEEAGLLDGQPTFRYRGKLHVLGTWQRETDPRIHDDLVVSRPVIARDSEGGSLPIGTEHARLYPIAEAAVRRAEEKARARAARAERKTTPMPVDQLGMLPMLAARPDHILPAPPGGPEVLGRGAGAYIEARPAPRGRAAIEEWLAKKGITLVRLPSGKVLVRAPGGRASSDVIEVVTVALPLLAPAQPPRCELEHKGTPPEAVTVLAVGILSCGSEEHTR